MEFISSILKQGKINVSTGSLLSLRRGIHRATAGTRWALRGSWAGGCCDPSLGTERLLRTAVSAPGQVMAHKLSSEGWAFSVLFCGLHHMGSARCPWPVAPLFVLWTLCYISFPSFTKMEVSIKTIVHLHLQKFWEGEVQVLCVGFLDRSEGPVSLYHTHVILELELLPRLLQRALCLQRGPVSNAWPGCRASGPTRSGPRPHPGRCSPRGTGGPSGAPRPLFPGSSPSAAPPGSGPRPQWPVRP